MMKNINLGRSMVEMLGVLAIIGVLSVGAVSGFRYAMDKARANRVVSDASLVYAAVSTSERTYSVFTQININSESGLTFQAFKGISTYIKAVGVPQNVCNHLLKMKNDRLNFYQDNPENDLMEEINSCANATQDMVFAFDGAGTDINAQGGGTNNQGGEVIRPCSINNDCDIGEICHKGKCVMYNSVDECEESSDCSDGETCCGGKCCENGCDGWGGNYCAECEDSGDCGGNSCCAGLCCGNDYGCDGNATCSDCSEDEHCGVNEHCSGYHCCPEGEEYNDENSSCEEGGEEENECAEAEDGTSCDDDSGSCCGGSCCHADCCDGECVEVGGCGDDDECEEDCGEYSCCHGECTSDENPTCCECGPKPIEDEDGCVSECGEEWCESKGGTWDDGACCYEGQYPCGGFCAEDEGCCVDVNGGANYCEDECHNECDYETQWCDQGHCCNNDWHWNEDIDDCEEDEQCDDCE